LIAMREKPWSDVRRECGHPVKPEWASLPYATFDHLVAGHEDAQVYCQTCGRWQWPEAVQERLRQAAARGIVTQVTP
jgi:uncharacterized protein with PIN domain